MNTHLTVHVPRSIDLDRVLAHLEQKLDALLVAFDPGLVQLQGRLVRHTSREGVNCHLNLHLPTAQLSSEETAATAQLALRTAGTEMLRQVRKHKQRLRMNRSRLRARPGVVRRLAVRPVSRPTRAELNGARERRREELAHYFGEHYPQVLKFVERQIELRERLGDLEPGNLEPREVLDEIVVTALAPERPGRRGGAAAMPPASRGRWLLVLAADAIRRLTKSTSGIEHGLHLQPLQHEPRSMDEFDPEQLLATEEMMENLTQALQSLPEAQRHDMVLYLLEGFRLAELAQLSHRTPAEVETSLQEAAAALRRNPGFPARLYPRLQLAALPRGA